MFLMSNLGYGQYSIEYNFCKSNATVSIDHESGFSVNECSYTTAQLNALIDGNINTAVPGGYCLGLGDYACDPASYVYNITFDNPRYVEYLQISYDAFVSNEMPLIKVKIWDATGSQVSFEYELPTDNDGDVDTETIPLNLGVSRIELEVYSTGHMLDCRLTEVKAISTLYNLSKLTGGEMTNDPTYSGIFPNKFTNVYDDISTTRGYIAAKATTAGSFTITLPEPYAYIIDHIAILSMNIPITNVTVEARYKYYDGNDWIWDGTYAYPMDQDVPFDGSQIKKDFNYASTLMSDGTVLWNYFKISYNKLSTSYFQVNEVEIWGFKNQRKALRIVNPNMLNKLNNAKTKAQMMENLPLEMDIFPNPTDGNFQIKLNQSTSTTTHVQVYSLDGKVIYEQNQVEGNLIDVTLNNASKGMYMLKVVNGSSVITKKFNVQ